MKTINFHAMGSKILIAMDTDDILVMDEVLRARDWFEQWEESFSRFRLTSELSQLNRLPGIPMKVSEDFFDVAMLALNMESRTNGQITPTILNALETAGYTESFEKLTEQTWAVLNQPYLVENTGGREIQLNESSRTITLGYGTKIDFGGFAKGWAAHQTMLRLKKYAPVLVDAGGDISISEPLTDGTPWPIGVADPVNKEVDLDLLMIEKGGIATSGRDYRRWKMNNLQQHHLIDTRSNKPAQTDVMASTVIAENVMEAEMQAKMGMILGSEDGSTWLNSQPGIDYLLVLENGLFIKSAGYSERQWNFQWNQLVQNP